MYIVHSLKLSAPNAKNEQLENSEIYVRVYLVY